MNKCEYCSDENTIDLLRGDNGVVKVDDKYIIYAEHFRNERVIIENVKYCPMCGIELR